MKRPATAPVYAAYADAIDRQCPSCAADPDTWCTHPDGTPRIIPCLARSKNTTGTETP